MTWQAASCTLCHLTGFSITFTVPTEVYYIRVFTRTACTLDL